MVRARTRPDGSGRQRLFQPRTDEMHLIEALDFLFEAGS
jgi:hypothetical protein